MNTTAADICLDEFSNRAKTNLYSAFCSPRAALSLIFFVHGVIGAGWVSRLPYFQEKYSVGPGLLSMALFCCAAGAICAMPLSRKLNFGTKNLTVLFTLFQCLLVLLLPLASTFPMFCISLALYGFGASCMNINMNAHGVKIERLSGRPIISSFHGFCSAGCMLGALVGGSAAQMNIGPGLQFLAISILMCLGTLLIRNNLLGDNKFVELVEPEQKSQVWSKPSRMLVALCVMALCSYVSEGAMGDWTAIYLHNSMHTSQSFAALGFGFFSVAMCLGRFAGELVIRRFGAVRSVRCSALLAVLGLVCAFLGNSPLIAILGFAAVGLGFSIIVPTVYSATASLSKNVGAAIATVSLFGYAGILGGPPIIGMTAELIGLRFALLLLAFLAITIAVLAGFMNAEREDAQVSATSMADEVKMESLADSMI